jgi:hypothetical protein
MVLDPWTAMGLAGNIVQFVDFGCKLISETRTIYKSKAGASERTRNLETITADLEQLCDGLAISVSRGTTMVDENLRRIAFECQEVAKELRTVLLTLHIDGKETVWSSFIVAVQEIWTKDRVTSLASRLDALQGQLNTHILSTLL